MRVSWNKWRTIAQSLGASEELDTWMLKTVRKKIITRTWNKWCVFSQESQAYDLELDRAMSKLERVELSKSFSEMLQAARYAYWCTLWVSQSWRIRMSRALQKVCNDWRRSTSEMKEFDHKVSQSLTKMAERATLKACRQWRLEGEEQLEWQNKLTGHALSKTVASWRHSLVSQKSLAAAWQWAVHGFGQKQQWKSLKVWWQITYQSALIKHRTCTAISRLQKSTMRKMCTQWRRSRVESRAHSHRLSKVLKLVEVRLQRALTLWRRSRVESRAHSQRLSKLLKLVEVKLHRAFMQWCGPYRQRSMCERRLTTSLEKMAEYALCKAYSQWCLRVFKGKGQLPYWSSRRIAGEVARSFAKWLDAYRDTCRDILCSSISRFFKLSEATDKWYQIAAHAKIGRETMQVIAYWYTRQWIKLRVSAAWRLWRAGSGVAQHEGRLMLLATTRRIYATLSQAWDCWLSAARGGRQWQQESLQLNQMIKLSESKADGPDIPALKLELHRLREHYLKLCSGKRGQKLEDVHTYWHSLLEQELAAITAEKAAMQITIQALTKPHEQEQMHDLEYQLRVKSHLVVNLEIELQKAVMMSVEQAGELRQVRSVLKRVGTCQILVKQATVQTMRQVAHDLHSAQAQKVEIQREFELLLSKIDSWEKLHDAEQTEQKLQVQAARIVELESLFESALGRTLELDEEVTRLRSGHDYLHSSGKSAAQTIHAERTTGRSSSHRGTIHAVQARLDQVRSTVEEVRTAGMTNLQGHTSKLQAPTSELHELAIDVQNVPAQHICQLYSMEAQGEPLVKDGRKSLAIPTEEPNKPVEQRMARLTVSELNEAQSDKRSEFYQGFRDRLQCLRVKKRMILDS